MHPTAVGPVLVPQPDGAGGTKLVTISADTLLRAAKIEVRSAPGNAGKTYVGTTALVVPSTAVIREFQNNVSTAPEQPVTMETQDATNRLYPADYALGGEEVQAAAKTITGAVSNGGLVRITAIGHGYSTGDIIRVAAVCGVPAANGLWTITVIDANTFDLQGSAFSGAYTSGGTAKKVTQSTLHPTYWVG